MRERPERPPSSGQAFEAVVTRAREATVPIQSGSLARPDYRYIDGTGSTSETSASKITRKRRVADVRALQLAARGRTEVDGSER
jgi:hypothetical protein